MLSGNPLPLPVQVSVSAAAREKTVGGRPSATPPPRHHNIWQTDRTLPSISHLEPLPTAWSDF